MKSAWTTKKLGQICDISMGFTPARANSKFWGPGYNWLSIADMSQGKDLKCTKESITTDAVCDRMHKLIEPGTLLMSFKLSIGKLGFARVPMFTNEAIVALPVRDKKELLPEYLYYALDSIDLVKGTDRAVMGNTLNKAKLEELEIPLPPLDEQRRIAAILDKADAIRRKRQESIRLTEEFLRSTFLEMFGDIPAKKSKYDFGAIRGLVSAQSGKSSNQVISQEKTDIPIYGGNGINGWATKALFEDNVVVVGRVGQQCGIVHITEGPAWVTDNAIVIKITDSKKLHPIYVAEALQKSPLRSTVEQLDLPFINQSTILDYPIPLPPLDKQLEFVKIREKLLDSRLKLNKSNIAASQMFNSLTHRAFLGEL